MKCHVTSLHDIYSILWTDSQKRFYLEIYVSKELNIRFSLVREEIKYIYFISEDDSQSGGDDSKK